QKADCTERWLRFTSREVAHYYFAPNKAGNHKKSASLNHTRPRYTYASAPIHTRPTQSTESLTKHPPPRFPHVNPTQRFPRP
ncbi:hypothetical protein DIE18_21365, partial [Burkholderia sp. Bp9125]